MGAIESHGGAKWNREGECESVSLEEVGGLMGLLEAYWNPWSGAISDLAVFTNQNTKTLSTFMAICIAVIAIGRVGDIALLDC